jgi:hypothetical protein
MRLWPFTCTCLINVWIKNLREELGLDLRANLEWIWILKLMRRWWWRWSPIDTLSGPESHVLRERSMMEKGYWHEEEDGGGGKARSQGWWWMHNTSISRVGSLGKKPPGPECERAASPRERVVFRSTSPFVWASKCRESLDHGWVSHGPLAKGKARTSTWVRVSKEANVVTHSSVCFCYCCSYINE